MHWDGVGKSLHPWHITLKSYPHPWLTIAVRTVDCRFGCNSVVQWSKCTKLQTLFSDITHVAGILRQHLELLSLCTHSTILRASQPIVFGQ